MAFLIPSPSAVVELSRYAVGQVVGQVVETAASAATVPVRVFALLSQAELLVSRITVVAERAETLVERLESTAERAESLIGRVGAVVDEAGETVRRTTAIVAAAAVVVEEAATVATGAAGVVTRTATVVDQAELVSDTASGVVRQVGATAAEAADLLDGYAPTLRAAAPLAERFIAELTPEEVTAAIRMIDELPRLREHLSHDVMPLLGKLDQVGPDLHSLLEVTSDLHLAIAGIPGLRMLRRRGEQKLDDEEEATNGR